MSSAVLASSAKRAATLGSEARELSASNCPRRISLICAAFLLMNGCPFYFAGQQPAGVTGGLGTILDILTVLFFVLGFALVLRMVGKRRRDVLHGPYVTKTKRDEAEGEKM